MRLPDVELLTPDQERSLAASVEAGVLARAVLAGAAPHLSVTADLAELHILDRAGRAAENAFLEANLRLVKLVSIRSAAASGVPEEDLFQDGWLGLVDALWRYDHRRGVRFASYALPWIRARVSESIARHQPVRQPTARTRTITVGLDQAEHVELAGTDAGFTEAELRSVPLKQLTAQLPRRMRAVVRWRFGFDGRCRTYDEIARDLGCSCATARRLEQRALARLQRRLVRYGVRSAEVARVAG